MVTRRTSRPLSSFLLRVAERREERVSLQYELRDLRGGVVHRFASLAALARFLASRQGADVAEGPTTAGPRPPRKRKQGAVRALKRK